MLSSKDCTDFLVNSPVIQELVRDRCGILPDGSFDEAPDPEMQIEYQSWVQNGKNPKKWKRVMKYNLGSPTDMEHFQYSEIWPQYTRGPHTAVVRHFWLDGTDHITVALIEYNNQIVEWDDLSD